VQQELPDGEMLAEVLSERKARKVTFGPPAFLQSRTSEMVERNAEYERRELNAWASQRSSNGGSSEIDLPDLPRRGEGYDISHIQGAQAVASQVVFIDGNPAKQHYRHYKIKNPVTAGHSDDFVLLAR